MVVTTSPRPKAPTGFQKAMAGIKADVRSDISRISAALRGEDYTDPNPERTAARTASSRAALESMQGSDGSRSSAPKPSAKELMAQRARARMIAEGKKSRKKFEAKKGKKVAKRRKLLLSIKEAST